MNDSHRRALTVLVSLGVLCSATTGWASAAVPGERTHPAARTDQRAGPHARTQDALDAIVRQGTPGVIAEVRSGHRVWNGEAGVAVLGGRPRASGEHFRIASMTKPFTATVVLKLEAEGRLSLDDSVERWLPGVVRGPGYRPQEITIRQLLNHTSGIPNYNDDEDFRARYAGDAFDRHRYDRVAPRELVDIALAHPPVFRPGAPGRWKYSDTNYILAGMVIEKAARTTYKKAVETRILKPHGLHGTSVPETSPNLPRPHAVHYSTLFEDGPDARVRDVTEFSPTVAFAAGQIISTTADVNTFMSELLKGEVLEPAQQREMFRTVAVDGDDMHGGADDRYGLGVREFELAPGCRVWGHGGMIPGSASRTAAARDGRHVLTMNRNGDWGEQELEDAVLKAEFC